MHRLSEFDDLKPARTEAFAKIAKPFERSISALKKTETEWTGEIMLGVGWALLDAKVGDNRPHRHLAHQVSLVLAGPVSVIGTDMMGLAEGMAILIPAGFEHSLQPAGAILRTLYVDPTFRGVRGLDPLIGVTTLTVVETNSLAAIRSSQDAQVWIETFLRKGAVTRIDHRLRTILDSLDPGTSPAELARILGISTTRLREISVRDFGVPTTKLLQWLQVQKAIEAFELSHNLAEAAAAGGFSDQAHFTRRLVEWFGVTPSRGLAKLKITTFR